MSPVNLRILIVAVLFMTASCVFAQTTSNSVISIKQISNTEILVEGMGIKRRCRIDDEVRGTKKSSDGQAVIISGTSYVLTDDLLSCDLDVAVRAKKAAPHVGFLSDVSVKEGIYASLVPVSVNPMSFVAVVAKLGSDRNMINLPGFYRDNLAKSVLLAEAASVIAPTFSVDARYVSLDLFNCELERGTDIFVIEVLSGKRIQLSRAMCEKEFVFR